MSQLDEKTYSMIVAYVLNCSLDDVKKTSRTPAQNEQIAHLVKALEECLRQILPSLAKNKTYLLEEHNFALFHLVPAPTALHFLQQELSHLGLNLTQNSFQPDLQLAFSDSSGFLLSID